MNGFKDLYRELGMVVRYFRKQDGLSQEKLGAMVGMSGSSISYIETGTYIPSPEILLRMSTALRLPVRNFINRRTIDMVNELDYLKSFDRQ
jgi:transcriptional regulator with XRE-family HTH domain